MGDRSKPRRHHFEDQTSDIAVRLNLPVEPPNGPGLKALLRRFLGFLGALARRLDS